jgi:hypothetical protein
MAKPPDGRWRQRVFTAYADLVETADVEVSRRSETLEPG